MMNISKEELSRKIVQYIASEINAMDCVGDLKFNITPKEKQKHYRDWAQQEKCYCQGNEKKLIKLHIFQS